MLCFRLHEFDEQIQWVREGMARIVPVPLLALFTGYELETMVSIYDYKLLVTCVWFTLSNGTHIELT